MTECRFCGNQLEERVIESNKTRPAAERTDFCRFCYYGGRTHEEKFKPLITELQQIWKTGGVKMRVHVDHTGGGCFAITMRGAADYPYLMATADGDGILPETEA